MLVCRRSRKPFPIVLTGAWSRTRDFARRLFCLRIACRNLRPVSLYSYQIVCSRKGDNMADLKKAAQLFEQLKVRTLR